MRVPDFILKCVGFVCQEDYRDSGGVPYGDPQGTGFFVSVPCEHPEMSAKGLTHVYFVTAKHVIDGLKKKPFFSVNEEGGGKATIERIIGDRWWHHPTDKTADVAIAPVWPHRTADIVSVNVVQLGTPEVLSAIGVGIGDEVVSTGLFTPAEGIKKNLPIVRHGNIAMMPDEQIQTEFGYADVYLVEARSLPGLSGSPVFVRPTIDFKVEHKISSKKTDVFCAGATVVLLGLMQSHWDVKESDINEVYVAHDRKRGVNMGIATVVPAIKILETINQEALVTMRREAERRATRNMVPGMDSVKSKHRELSQKTATGLDIPVRTSGEFFDTLKKASRKIATPEKE